MCTLCAWSTACFPLWCVHEFVSAHVECLLLFSLRLLQSVAAIIEATVLQLWKWTGLGCTDATAVAPTMVIAASTSMVRGSN